jgi:exosortase J
MSLSAYAEKPLTTPVLRWNGSALIGAVCVAVFTLLGLFSILPSLVSLWGVWTNDPLRSIGVFFPFVSVALVLREAKRLDWKLRGSWWGLLPLTLAILVEHLRQTMVLAFQVAPHLILSPRGDGSVVFGYACGIVLLFGGKELFRRSLFPLALLLCLNPVPYSFNSMVDVPLQYISAHIARNFAIALGQPLTPDQLRLMFSPTFGIYIAPGCNGIRGSITMGYIALITGFLCRFPFRLHALTVAGAVLLGYVFNFLRLCLLVIYYVVALHLPALQNHGKNVDYGIGSCLFTIAAVLLSLVVLRASRKVEDTEAATETTSRAETPVRGTMNFRDLYVRLAVFAVVIFLGSVAYARTALTHGFSPSARHLPVNLAELYPARMGGFNLTRTWKERGVGDNLDIYDWAEYRRASSSETINIGISPKFGAHDAILCHLARGEDPSWRGTEHFTTSDGKDIAFSAFFYNDGVTQLLEASTLCGVNHCGETSTMSSNFKVLYSAPLPQIMVNEAYGRSVPVVLKAEIADPTVPANVAQQRLEASMRDFISGTSLASLSGKYFSN